MELHELKPAEGSRKTRNRVGRGIGSGNGKTAGRGMKGQKSRSGGGKYQGFEGGQMPIYRRLPKFGSRKTHTGVKIEYAVVNLEKLNVFEDGATVTTALILEKGLVKKELSGVKILGKGTLSKKLTVQVAAFSASAKAAIEAAGGKAEVIE